MLLELRKRLIERRFRSKDGRFRFRFHKRERDPKKSDFDESSTFLDEHLVSAQLASMLIGWQLVTSDSCRSICDSRQSIRGATPLPTSNRPQYPGLSLKQASSAFMPLPTAIVFGPPPPPTRIILGLRPQSKASVFDRHSSPDRNQTSDLGLRRQANIASLAESSLAPPASTTTHFDYARCSYVNIARFAHGARVVSTKFAHQASATLTNPCLIACFTSPTIHPTSARP